MTYEELLIHADNNNITVREKPIKGNDGRISRNRIAVRKTIPTIREKACVLAEEIGHYYTTTGDILDQSTVENRKQEQKARLWAYNHMVSLIGLIRAFEHGCRNLSETAEFLDVTDQFLAEALERYRQKYGIFTTVDNYIIYFEPNIRVGKMI